MSFRIYVDRLYRDMTPEEEAEYLSNQDVAEASAKDYEEALSELGVNLHGEE